MVLPSPIPTWSDATSIVLFPKREWPLKNPDPKTVLELAGTWHDLRRSNRALSSPEHGSVFAMYICPQCKRVIALTDKYHAVNPNGYVVIKGKGEYGGACSDDCSFARIRLLDEWNPKRRLYAIAFERGTKEAGTRYVHAESQAEARWQYNHAHDPLRQTRVIAVAPAIGFHVKAGDEDKEKRVLIAD